MNKRAAGWLEVEEGRKKEDSDSKFWKEKRCQDEKPVSEDVVNFEGMAGVFKWTIQQTVILNLCCVSSQKTFIGSTCYKYVRGSEGGVCL